MKGARDVRRRRNPQRHSASNMTDHHLKQHLFDQYGGFADKRVKNLEKADRFIVDARRETDSASDGNLYSYFCKVFAEVASPDAVEVQLIDNIPMGAAVSAWIEQYDPTLRDGNQASMSFPVAVGQEGKLDELAAAFRSIVRPGAPRYQVANYKYVCPRTAGSLDRLASVLREFAS